MTKPKKGKSADESVILESEISFYKKESTSFKLQLEALNNFLTIEQLKQLDEADLSARLKYAERVQANFERARSTLKRMDRREFDSDADENFLKTYLEVEAKLSRSLNSTRKASHAHSSTMRQPSWDHTSTPCGQRRSRLPELKIPVFSGAYLDWPSFFSTFSSAIDNDLEMSKLEKMQYLITSLEGAALDTVRSLEPSEENYDKALDLLKSRFDNKLLLFQAHIKAIFGLQSVEMGKPGGLRKLSDDVNSHLRALQTLATSDEIYNGLLIHIITSKLPPHTHEKWEENLSTQKLPTWFEMSTFLEKRCRMAENLENATVIQAPSKQVGKNLPQPKSKASVLVTATSVTSTSICNFCDSRDHFISGCIKFLNLSPKLRFKEAKKLRLCINCLRKGHSVKQCKSGNCRHCQAKHNSLLHLSSISSNQENGPMAVSAAPNTTNQAASPQSTLVTSLAASLSPKLPYSNCVLLATAIVLVKNRSGTLIPCRAILDSASQLNFVTTRLANQLQLRSRYSPVSVSGIGEASIVANKCVDIFTQAQHGQFSASFEALVTPSITDYQPNFDISIEGWNIPNNITLADPSFFKARRVDLLIGAELFYDLICVGQVRIAANLPTLQKTKLGWVVSGGISHVNNRLTTLSAFRNSTPQEDSNAALENIVKRFWEVENSFTSTPVKADDAFCEQHFIENFLRLPSGAYSVRLPPKSNFDTLGESYEFAVRRFKALERKLEKDEPTKRSYSAFMQEYKDLGHMSLATLEAERPTYFLPHHCVHKQDSTTTKLRVVFDGSAKTSSGSSLNDLLLPGPTIQPTLFNTLLRFRFFKVALCGDICKMYRCVKIGNPDNQLQCILWRDDPSKEIDIYKLETVTYGTRPAAFLAIRAMHQLTYDEEESYPIGAKVIRRDFYVDDLISGGETIEEVIQIKQEVKQLLRRGNFPIRKWCSNEACVLQDEDKIDCEQLLKFHDGTDVTKALGLVWDPTSDNFLFSFTPIVSSGKATKRSILAVIARFYDPLGLISPVITKLKIFMQALWKEKLAWDESLPQSLHTTWMTLCSQMSTVSSLHFPRYVLAPKARLQIHAFCDASLSAYGACIYTRVECQGDIKTQLLCSKSRVSPLKSLTIPKLELSAALLLAELVSNILENGQLSCDIHCWSDSMIVLSWLQSPPGNFNIFVANRVAEIQSLTSGMTWHHVPTDLNPADILSRGCAPKELLLNDLWTNGPLFLQLDSLLWPENKEFLSNLPERRRCTLVSTTKVDETFGCKFKNSFGKLKRVFAYIYKFIHFRTKHNTSSPTGLLTIDDINAGTRLLIRHIQQVHFASEYKALSESKKLSSSSNLLSLNPFIDDFGALRVGGRLHNSNLDFDAKHPLVLPKHHPVTNAIIEYFHYKLLHAGPQSLLASIRQQFWPIGGRKTVAKVVNKCLRCYRLKPIIQQQIMGNLPGDRVKPSRTFYTTGIDYCGPFHYKNYVRNRQPVKCYICIFVCFATKATHLEVVHDLSTQSFIAALKRFISVRGKPRTIWSDNATNFVGAKNELEDLRRLFLNQDHIKTVAEVFTENQIDWKFIPPRSPHFGGLWESAVKSAKLHFYRTVGTSILTFDELRTLVCEISSILNSRPLCPITENPDDLDVLTPAHFLIGGPFIAINEPNVTHLDVSRLSRWQRVCHMQQIFWQKWSTSYLSLLQERVKWKTSTPDLQQGAMVILKDDNLPPLKWKLGRVERAISGHDGHVRAAIVRTENGPVKRAITKIAVLPVETDIVESLHLPKGGVCSQLQSTQ